ncbi:MAG: class I SAM-dependent methyltransferase [Chitinophagales bacterium]
MNLYQELSQVYHEMYQNLFDYDEEFGFYHSVLERFEAKKVVEFGCGTGNLAKRFLAANFDYLGVDLNQEMLDIAAISLPRHHFLQSDMCTFSSPSLFEAALITGRTISYLSTNKDILQAFEAIRNCLAENGLLVFDAIDATLLFEDFDESEKELKVGKYKRISYSTPNLQTGWTWDWHSTYFAENEGQFEAIGNDFATVRAFTQDELKLLLTIAGFEVLEVIEKNTYTWADHYFVARKK